jgi:response regulator RpfG family c-di-GMP phosphodiesterase
MSDDQLLNGEPKPVLLLVDDDELVLNALRRLLEGNERELLTACDGSEALQMLERQPVALVISDQRMPNMTGLELFREIKKRWPETVRVLLTGYAEMNLVIEAINQGEVYRFLTKPWDTRELLQMVAEILTGWRRRQRENIESYSTRLQKANLETVMALAEAVELKDLYTKGHCVRVRDYSLQLARALDLDADFRRDLIYASLLHDCGKIGISEAILNIEGPLTPEQYREIQRHPVLGFQMTCKIEYLRAASIIIRQHHECWDGSGYPDGLEGREISLGARIIAIADSFDAMTSSRPYRRALDYQKAIAELEAGRGTQFDPELVDLFISLQRESEALGAEHYSRHLLLVGLPEETVTEIRMVLAGDIYEIEAVTDASMVADGLGQVDLVICDYHLPGDSENPAVAFLTRCRWLQPGVIRMLLVERREVEDIGAEINQAGLYAYMIEPLRPNEIPALIDNAFEWRRMVRDLNLEGE